MARDKSLSKKLLAYHRISVPEFEVFRIGRPIRRPKRLPFPLIVKSLTQEASIGISQASVVDSDEKLKERVAFIHESIGTAAIVEQYIEGRELYVGILGNQALQAMGWHLDGLVTAVVGTHTHVQTADDRLLPKGTAYLTDVGMNPRNCDEESFSEKYRWPVFQTLQFDSSPSTQISKNCSSSRSRTRTVSSVTVKT